jgi:hypothetical protein
MSNLGVRIGDKHTYRDWGLRWLEPYEIPYPEPWTYTVDIPGSDGILDLTEHLTGYVRYKNRVITLNFDAPDKNYYEYETLKQQIAAYLHGKRHKIYLDIDSTYYYDARITLASDKDCKIGSTITLTCDADPYKYEEFTTLDDWLWDPFNFETDLIRETKDLLIVGTTNVHLAPTQIPVVPRFICDNAMTLKYKDETINLPVGTTESPYIVLENEENILTFIGNGTVTILYRGGAL